MFLSQSLGAVHLELVSDLITDAFVACLRWFVSRRGNLTFMLSDYCRQRMSLEARLPAADESPLHRTANVIDYMYVCLN